MKIKIPSSNFIAAVALFVAIPAFAADAPALEKNKRRADVDALHGKPAPPLKLKEWAKETSAGATWQTPTWRRPSRF